VIKLLPVGMISGVGYDGMAVIADVGRIDERLVATVFDKLERSKLNGDKGIRRYFLAIGKRRI